MVSYDLPFPPSSNNAYFVRNGRKVLSAAGRQYHASVAALLAGGPKAPPGRLHATLELWPPNKCRRDICNCEKILTDAVKKAGAIEDDSLIDVYLIVRREVRKGGAARLTLRAAGEWTTAVLPVGAAAGGGV